MNSAIADFKQFQRAYLFRALTERIVSVLPRMKCPHRIEPHQIQGLDFIHIFPVVQVGWFIPLSCTLEIRYQHPYLL